MELQPRMLPLTWIVIVGVLCQGLTTVASVAGRHQKLQDLLNTLGTYSKYHVPTVPQDITETSSTQAMLEVTSPPMNSFALDFDKRNQSSSIRSYQDFYRVFYGSSEGMDHLRKHYGPTRLQDARANFGFAQELDDVRKANEHYLRIRTKARCKVPAAQLVRVRDFYPDPSKEYLPRCTILHRCGESSGCCDNEAFECVPSAVQEVTLHFYSLTLGKYGFNHKQGNNVEKLLFVNHTACQCQPINDLPRAMQDSSQHPQVGIHKKGVNRDGRQSKCRECPVPFTNRVYKDGRCGCDCFDKQKPCLRIKRGREPLMEIERRCVEANHCHIPDCEFGLYDQQTGYCPRRHDEIMRTTSHRPYPANHRWAFMERD